DGPPRPDAGTRQLLGHPPRLRARPPGGDRPVHGVDEVLVVGERVVEQQRRQVEPAHGTSGCHTGSRFSANASGPSSWSGWPHIDTSSRAPSRQASVRPCSIACHSARFVAAIAAGELRAIFSASAGASSRRRSGGSTIWLIIPSSYARCAEIRS